MNVFPTTYINNTSSDNTTNKWSMFNSWKDLVFTYGGKWWTLLLSDFSVLSKLYIIEGSFSKGGKLNLPLPYACYQTELFDKFDFYLYSKKIDYKYPDNYIVFNEVEFRDDYTGRVVLYLASDVIPTTALEKFTVRSLNITWFYLPLTSQFNMCGVYSFTSSLILPINSSAYMFGIYSHQPSITLPTFLTANIYGLYTITANSILRQSAGVYGIKFNNTGKWYYYNSWGEMSNAWNQA